MPENRVAFVWERNKLYFPGDRVGHRGGRWECRKGHVGDWITEPEIGLYWDSYWKKIEVQ
ncbi:hypothetical protein DACRYDRAFT_102916 [Dacryopinax primogenitus]|uniref:Chitin-binding type-3 domain-containing protein n=1 Tax=Dacryopinax primogenitus (strain DJM 731) TaxID=1858805 RepID=M5G6S4_DACPD|nr:uncharacterized protein DACRYDRAFT_102916 [Dacryopinax primogenitus]EJU05956.1 hypothetical protein DACRYDRAFT_102916 [Dacryopinax primogenitus]